jgi:TRAP-type C4-dicarboxylate transport system permease small subunit
MIEAATFDKVLGPVRRAVRAGVVVIFSALVLVVFAQVIARSVFSAPFAWSEELARYLQVWLILLASAACVRKQLHLTVDYAVHALAARAQRRLQAVALGAVAFFLVVVIVSSLSLIAATGNQMTPALHIPIRAVYVALPVGALLMLLETLALAARLLGPPEDIASVGRRTGDPA